MRKLILTMILGLAAGIAKADVMLYWTVEDPPKKGETDTLDYSYAVIYGISHDDEKNLDVYTALDAVTAGSGAIDTNVSGGTKEIPGLGGSAYANYIVRLFNNSEVTYESSIYSYNSLAASVWATDMLSMKATTAKGFGNFQAVAVPEPTSGLLLLLGVAGLALKRKRA